MRDRQPERASEPETRRSAPDPPPHLAVLALQRQVGNRAVARLLAREALASSDSIDATYASWLRVKAGSLGLKISDPEVMSAAGAATRTQVGSLNYDLWRARRAGGTMGGGKPSVPAPPIPGGKVMWSSTRALVMG